MYAPMEAAALRWRRVRYAKAPRGSTATRQVSAAVMADRQYRKLKKLFSPLSSAL